MTAYQTLEARFRRESLLGEAQAMLNWDSATLMPEGAASSRAEQIALLKVLAHEILTAPETGDLLRAAEEGQRELDSWQRANLREMRRQWLHATAVPPDLVEALTKACSACEMIWRKARPANDFALVRPSLEEVLRLVREVADAKAARLGKSPYEALLDEYEPDGSTVAIDRLFNDLAAMLPGLIDAVLARQHARPEPMALGEHFPVEQQRLLGVELMRRLGFDFDHGRLDISLHPFCGGTADDVRITTRYDEANFTRALMGVLCAVAALSGPLAAPVSASGVPVKPMKVAFGRMSLMASCRSPDCVRWHSSTKTKRSPLAAKSRGSARFSSAMYSGMSPTSSPSSLPPNLWMREHTSQGTLAFRVATRSAPLLVRWIGSSTPRKTLSICSSSSVRSVMISTRASRTFSRSHLASHTIVRLFPEPWVCQMIPPSRRLARS
jgi:hypothetical protein